MSSIKQEDLPTFIAAYQKAHKEGAETFMFKGTEVVTQYAKYVIEYAVGLCPNCGEKVDASTVKATLGDER